MKPILDLGAGPMDADMPKPASAKKVGTLHRIVGHAVTGPWRLNPHVVEYDLTGEKEAHALRCARDSRRSLPFERLGADGGRFDAKRLGQPGPDGLVSLSLWQILPRGDGRDRRPFVWSEPPGAARAAHLFEQDLGRLRLLGRRWLEDDDAPNLFAPDRGRGHAEHDSHAHPLLCLERILHLVQVSKWKWKYRSGCSLYTITSRVERHLVRRDLLATTLDQLLGAPLDREVAVGVEDADVPCEEEAVRILRRRPIRA
eukprot:scaffold42267_cov66-Phaeocystis_antarctica.AAC.4